MASIFAPGAEPTAPRGPLPFSVPHRDISGAFQEPGQKQQEHWAKQPCSSSASCSCPGPPNTGVWAPGTCMRGSGCLLVGWPSLGLGPQPAQGSPLGFPKCIKTKEKLCEYLTVVIFTASAQHAAVNFGQVGKDRASPLGGRWPGPARLPLRALGGPPYFLNRSGDRGVEGPGVWCSRWPVEFGSALSTGCQCEGGGFPSPAGVGGRGSGRWHRRQRWVRAALQGHPAGSVAVPAV